MSNLSSEQKIFCGVLEKNNPMHNERRHSLITLFNDDTIFKNEYYILFKVIKDNSPNIDITEAFISKYMSFNRANLLNSGCIDIGGYGNEDAYKEFAHATCELLKELLDETVTDNEFATALEDYRMTYVVDKSVNMLEEASVILTDGKQVGRVRYAGYEGVKSYLSHQMTKIDNVVDKTQRKGIVIYGVNDDKEEEDVEPAKLVTTFGIEKLDEAIGGLYEGDMLSLLAPAKGGKSRFATFVLHHAIVANKCNVVMWSLENGIKGWEALIRARHFEHMYNSDVTDVGNKSLINDDMIKKGKMPDKIREMEKASWIDLKYNDNYGRFASIDEEFDVDTFLDILDASVEAVNAKLVCIDYLQLIAGDKYGSKSERIATAYQKTLRYLKRKKIAGIFPAQFKQTVVGSLGKTAGGDLGSVEMRDAGGESYEIIKTPDINLSLYASMDDLKEGFVKCIPIPSRTICPFEPFDMIVDFGTSTYCSIDSREY